MEENKIIRKGFIAEGTTCQSCSTIIKEQAMKVQGVKKIEFDLAKEKGYVEFDPKETDIDTILSKIEEKGYTCFLIDEKEKNKGLGAAIGIIGFFVILYFLLKLSDSISLPQISQNMGYGLLFIVGLLTGLHCIAMCGGFVVSYSAKNAQEGRGSHISHLMYAIGKTLSYTIIGSILGFFGSIIAFTPTMRGIAGIVAGIFLILFGLKMLNFFPFLRKFQIKIPSVSFGKQRESGPFVIGLLNGLMIACGPLQAIYVMAIGTGSMIEGAKLLFVFALGTLPALLGFGYFTSFISSKLTNKILKFSGAVVIILGFIMLNNGLVLTGSGYDVGSAFSTIKLENTISSSSLQDGFPEIINGYQIIKMDVIASGWNPDTFVLKTGVPVKWVINGKEITSCNKAIQVPAYNLKFDVQKGEQTIEFTPTETGTVRWSCWMGMIQGTFVVKD